MKRGLHPGDVFSVDIGDDHHMYFQFIDTDSSQLNSDMVRVFKTKFPSTSKPSVVAVAGEPVDFWAHTMIKLGVKLGKWEKVGNAPMAGDMDVTFRDTNDVSRKLGQERVAVSDRWYVWRPNEPFQRIGLLTDEYKHAHIGLVVNPNWIVERMKSGAFDFVYPS